MKKNQTKASKSPTVVSKQKRGSVVPPEGTENSVAYKVLQKIKNKSVTLENTVELDNGKSFHFSNGNGTRIMIRSLIPEGRKNRAYEMEIRRKLPNGKSTGDVIKGLYAMRAYKILTSQRKSRMSAEHARELEAAL